MLGLFVDPTMTEIVAQVTTFLTANPVILVIFAGGAVIGLVIAAARKLARAGR